MTKSRPKFYSIHKFADFKQAGYFYEKFGGAPVMAEAAKILGKNKPLFERVVTVTGKSLSKPGNYMVRTGTPLIKLIEAARGLPDDTGKIINGGPMMGKAVSNTDVPVVKGMSGAVIFVIVLALAFMGFTGIVK